MLFVGWNLKLHHWDLIVDIKVVCGGGGGGGGGVFEGEERLINTSMWKHHKDHAKLPFKSNGAKCNTSKTVTTYLLFLWRETINCTRWLIETQEVVRASDCNIRNSSAVDHDLCMRIHQFCHLESNSVQNRPVIAVEFINLANIPTHKLDSAKSEHFSLKFFLSINNDFPIAEASCWFYWSIPVDIFQLTIIASCYPFSPKY